MTIVVDDGGGGGTSIFSSSYSITVNQRCYYLLSLRLFDGINESSLTPTSSPVIPVNSNVEIRGYIYAQDTGTSAFPCNNQGVSLYVNCSKIASTTTDAIGFFKFNVSFNKPGQYKLSIGLDGIACYGNESTVCTSYPGAEFKNCSCPL